LTLANGGFVIAPRCYDAVPPMPAPTPRSPWIRRISLILIVLAASGTLVWLLAPAAMKARSDNSIWRGQRLAAVQGCFACHRAPLRQDLVNPRSRFGAVPGFDGGELGLYADSRAEVEAWIRDGSPPSLRQDGAAWAAYQTQLLRMPPFGARLRDDQIHDLADFVIAANAFHSPADESAQRGEAIARAHCLSCHNLGGAGGLPNPGSAFGYVPGWWGPDFSDLAPDRAAVKEWIQTGVSARVTAWPLAKQFQRRQTVRMPAFADVLSEAEIDDTIAYLEWLGATGGGVRPEVSR
jgi:mono/diheme cytochrome c family protein